MAKREFLQLAHKFDDAKHGVASWFMSDKLDGMRAFWDGGLTRGMQAAEVPFANIEKDGRLLEQRVATGLWSRYGKPIAAPDWWLDHLPAVPLDGELYMGVQSFQKLVSVVKRLTPGPEWQDVEYVVFDSPTLCTVLADGEIKNTNYKKVLRSIRDELRYDIDAYRGFEREMDILRQECPENDVFRILEQEQLPSTTVAARQRVSDKLFEVTAAGGEGLMLRAPSSLWLPERCHTLLKVKRMSDAEGTVIGYVWGRKTELGSKLLGMMGALVLRLNNGKVLELSGFTDAERTMVARDPKDSVASIGEQHAGTRCDERVHNPTLPIGSRVSFKYRELTDDGIPKEARYWRKS